MKTAQEWFDEYAISHQNETNQLVHYICVPVIFFSVIGLLMSIPNKFLETNVFNYNIVPDSKDYIVKKLQVPAFPTHIVLDKNSNVMFTFAGYTPQVGELIKNAVDYYLE